MTKEITKAFILQEIQDKFKLRECEAEKFTFSEKVIPVYDVSPHLSHSSVQYKTVSVTSGPDSYTFFSVPWSERWHIHGYNVIFVTGSYTVAGLMIARRLAADYFYVDLEAAQSASYAVNLPKDLVGNPGDNIKIYVDGYTTTGDLMLRLDLTSEELR